MVLEEYIKIFINLPPSTLQRDSRLRLVDGTRGICIGSIGIEKRDHLFLEQF